MLKLSERDLMINRRYFQRLSPGLLLLWILVLQSCASRGVRLVHPQSGATARCGAVGMGIMAGSAESFVEECIRSYEARGFLAVDKLTPEQRADLERRGVLPQRDERPYM